MISAYEPPETAFFDVIIIGAGISGINAAYRLQERLPKYTYTILESRDAIGGTWDLFRYPGIRSDSDLYSFGFAWYPWDQPNPIAEGDAITSYVRKAASLHGLDKHILYQHRVSTASWSSEEHLWSLTVNARGDPCQFRARFVIFGTGYYDYNHPLKTDIPGIPNFQGQIIHPQFWPENLDYSGKRIVVIGSGATAITLIPNLVDKAQHVTMLQRNPGFIVGRSNRGKKSWLSSLLPTGIYLRWKRLFNILTAQLFYIWCRRNPEKSRAAIEKATESQLPEDIPLDPHFKPRYNPWEQRLCLCPDNDFFKSLRSGKASVTTDTIKEVTTKSISLNSGEVLDADIIVTATGLKVQMAGGIPILVDGKQIDISEKFIWKGSMLQDVPNAFLMLGYTNASWTLGADVAAHQLCRLIKHLERNKHAAAVPELDSSESLDRQPLFNLTSTYISRAKDVFPQAAKQGPWRGNDNYLSDMFYAKYGRLSKGLRFMPLSVKGKLHDS